MMRWLAGFQGSDLLVGWGFSVCGFNVLPGPTQDPSVSSRSHAHPPSTHFHTLSQNPPLTT